MIEVRCRRCNRLLCKAEHGSVVEAYCRHCKVTTRHEAAAPRVIYLSGRGLAEEEEANLAVRY